MRLLAVFAALACLASLTAPEANAQAAAALKIVQDGQKAATAPVTSDGRDKTLSEELSKTKFGRISTGKETMTIEEATRLETWYGLVRELIVAMIGLVPRLIIALMFLGLAWAVYRAVRKVLLGSLRKANVSASITDMLVAFTKWFFMGFGLVIAFNQIGIQITALLTGVSIIGLAIGFAAQETLANFIAGLVIFFDNPLQEGDWIEVEGVYGKVDRVTFRSTRIINEDGQQVIFPNTVMISRRIVNHSTRDHCTLTVPVLIGNDDDIEQTRRAVLAQAKKDQAVVPEPAPTLVVESISRDGVKLALTVLIKKQALQERKAVFHRILEESKTAADRARRSSRTETLKAAA